MRSGNGTQRPVKRLIKGNTVQQNMIKEMTRGAKGRFNNV